MIKLAQFWFDSGSQDSVNERIRHLERQSVNAGGPRKFAMVVRRLPAVKQFLLKHKDELSDDLALVVDLLPPA